MSLLNLKNTEFQMLIKKENSEDCGTECVVIYCKLNFLKILKCLMTLFSVK